MGYVREALTATSCWRDTRKDSDMTTQSEGTKTKNGLWEPTKPLGSLAWDTACKAPSRQTE